MDLLVAGERAVFVDAGLDVVTGDPLTGFDRREVDLIDHRPIGGDRIIGHRDTEVTLGLEDGEPEFPLEDDLVFG